MATVKPIKFRTSYRKLMKGVTLQVHVQIADSREFAVRQWLAMRLIRLAARLLHCQVDVQIKQEQKA